MEGLLEEEWPQKRRLVFVVVFVVVQRQGLQEVEAQVQGLQEEALEEQGTPLYIKRIWVYLDVTLC